MSWQVWQSFFESNLTETVAKHEYSFFLFSFLGDLLLNGIFGGCTTEFDLICVVHFDPHILMRSHVHF